MKTTNDIRKLFLKFFYEKKHEIVRSSSLVPVNDNTLLFTNAGMNQFKDVFLGIDSRSYNRATSSQKCLRAGGKHNDLENVGYTARHHTFFEMLGNFSFGDYFKEDAIKFAWEFLTSSKWLNIPVEKLLVTVYFNDNEAYDIWNKTIGLSQDKIIRIGDKNGLKFVSDNFWQMGDTGPCGPCTEIFYDHGEHVFGGIPGSKDEDGDRFIEIWNCVFMQYNRDAQGNMNLLPKPSVDTGMGLERIVAVLQGVDDNYHIDLFCNLMERVALETNVTYDKNNSSLKVIADHIRAASFLIAEGVYPGNEGRNYVLRRIIRRAIRHGFKLGQDKPFFYKVVPVLVKEMGDAYPELISAQDIIMKVLKEEEIKFSQTLSHGMKLLEENIKNNKALDAKIAFKLYDTYGFPFDLTADICREKNIRLSEEEFNEQMKLQKERARKNANFKQGIQLEYHGDDNIFTGYDNHSIESKILAIYKNNTSVPIINKDEDAIIVLDKTPFYAESGGQVGDQGELILGDIVYKVNNTIKIKANVFGHIGRLNSGSMKIHDIVKSQINVEFRKATARNHTATHILHNTLRKVFGDYIEQKGSLVAPDRLRFDFSCPHYLNQEQLNSVEQLVNQMIIDNIKINITYKDYESALRDGAIALFDERYQNKDKVRIVDIGGSSVELCGGAHVNRTGDIGLFKIISEGSIASGIRRIEALTGKESLLYIQKQEKNLKSISNLIKATNEDDLVNRVENIIITNKNLEKALDSLKLELSQYKAQELLKNAKLIKGVKLIVSTVDIDSRYLRNFVTNITKSNANLIVVLATNDNDKVLLIVGLSKNIVDKINANDVLKHVSSKVGAKGGGKADLAQAGGGDINLVDGALNSVYAFIESKL